MNTIDKIIAEIDRQIDICRDNLRYINDEDIVASVGGEYASKQDILYTIRSFVCSMQEEIINEDLDKDAIAVEVTNGAICGYKPEINVPMNGYKIGSKVKVVVIKEG